jgi:hypothetical protein
MKLVLLATVGLSVAGFAPQSSALPAKDPKQPTPQTPITPDRTAGTDNTPNPVTDRFKCPEQKQALEIAEAEIDCTKTAVSLNENIQVTQNRVVSMSIEFPIIGCSDLNLE